MLSELVNVGCALITALWMLLLAYWPTLTGTAALLLLLAFGLAAKQGRRGLAAVFGGTFVILALGLSALCWLPSDVILAVLPQSTRPFAQLLCVPAPLIVMFLAVTAMQALLREQQT
jgi:hypothetical protein